MPFEHLCFISYPNAEGEMVKTFAEELYLALKDEFGAWARDAVYFDKDRLTSGERYEIGLAQEICKSFCMIVVYSRIYEEHPFCIREFRAMQELEKKRMARLGRPYPSRQSMIIPFVLRGMKSLPKEIAELQCRDFSKFTVATPEISKNEAYTRQIAELAEQIMDYYREFENLDACKECEGFALPDANDIQPLRRSNEKPPKTFPGRPPAQ